MKHFISTLFVFSIGLTMYAQPADGTTCPDFTANDINGNSFNLYTWLDEGKTVVIHSFWTMDAPGWGYHSSNHLRNLSNLYSDDELTVLYLEGAASNTSAQITGTTPGTMGDWTDGNDFIFIDSAELMNTLSFESFGTTFFVCPDYTTHHVPHNSTTAAISQLMTESGCAASSIGIKEEKEISMTLYPNPAHNLVQFTFEDNNASNATYSIYASTGQLVLEGKMRGQKEIINTSEMERGVYQVKFQINGRIIIKKLVLA